MFNAFNDYIQAILDSGLDHDKAAELIGGFLEYRSLVKSEQRAIEGSLNFFREESCKLGKENYALSAKVAGLQKELAAAKAADTKTIRFHTGQAFDQARFMEHRFIEFVKWLRNEAIVVSDGTPVGLYEAKYIAEFIYAYFGYKELEMPTNTDGYKVITNTDSVREDVLDNIVRLLKAKYSGYKLVDLESTLWD